MKTIMIVDDDRNIRELLQCILTMLGYKTILFSDKKNAVAYVQQNPMEVGLMLLDYVIPPDTGMDIYFEVKKIVKIPAIFITGYCEETVNSMKDKGVLEVLSKPIDINRLKTLINAVDLS